MKVEQIIRELEKNGSYFKKSELNKIYSVINNKLTSEQLIEKLKKRIKTYVKKEDFGLMNISVGIKVLDEEIIINEGINNNLNESLFDLASITKLFTLKLCYEFKKLDLIDYNSTINSLDSTYKSIGNYKVIDILKMKGKIETSKRLAESKDKNDFIKTLKTVKVINEVDNAYTDIGFIILAKLLEKIYYEKYNEKLTFDQLCEKFIFKKLNLSNTCFSPKDFVVLGNGNIENKPHDPKTQIAGNVTGGAGIFSNALDFFKISNYINNYQFFDEKFIMEILNFYFLDDLKRKRSYAGLYTKTINNPSSYVPDVFSNYTLSHQGYTGGIVVFDIINKIHISILVDAIDHQTKLKRENYFKYFHKLKKEISLYTIMLYILKHL